MKTIIWSLLGTFALTTAAHAVPVVVQVLAADGQPVANAEVRATRRADNAAFFALYDRQAPLRDAARTDAKGMAHFDWPAPEEYQKLPATTRKYMAAATVWAADFGAINVSLNVGENSVKLPLAGVARGTVRDEKGAPVAGAKVSALSALSEKSLYNSPGMGMFAMAIGEADFTAVTDARGRWQIGHLPLGSRATVQLIDPELAANNAIAPVVPVDAPHIETPIEVTPDAVDQDGHLRALPGATLTGRVLNPQGEPLDDVMVLVTPSRSSFSSIHYKRARTDAQGNYRLERLEAGTYNLSLFPLQSSSLVFDPGAAREITLKSGQTQKVPDRKLIEGGTIEVQISDALSGQPLRNLSVDMQPETNFRAALAFSLGSNTNQAGKATMKAAPGRVRVYLLETPTGYVFPSSYDGRGQKMTIVAGKTQRVEWKLERGLSVGGRTVDAQGKVVPGVGIHYGRIGDDGQSQHITHGALSDKAGKWSARNFQAGKYELSIYQSGENQSPQWELVAPKTFVVPVRDTLDIVVKPIAQIALSGRVVDALGVGVAGARIGAKVTFPSMVNQNTLQSAAVSDASGSYTLPAFPATAKTVALNIERAGYMLQKAPEVTHENAQWSASDAVLQALSSHVSGRVVDADNQAQLGVQVLAARSGSVTTSDETGAWNFDNIALGETEIVAVGAAGVAVQSVTAGRDDLTLKLRPFTGAASRDIDSASAVLEDAWQTSRGSKFYERASLPATLAPYDPDAALAMARGGDARAADAVILQIVQVLAAKNPERAREWAPQVLASLEKPESKISAHLLLAQVTAEAHPDEAAAWLEKGIALFGELKDDWDKRDAAGKIAVLSVRLKRAEAQNWFERALELADSAKAEGVKNFSTLAWQVAAVDAEWAARAVAAGVKAAPDQPEYAQGPEVAAGAAIRRLATWNPEAAQKMLDKYGSLKGRYNSVHEMERAKSTLIIERLKRDGDVEAALKSARELGGRKIYLLTQIAPNAPLERRADILREALKLAPAIGIAQQLLPFDRALARQTLDAIAAKFQTPDASRDRWGRSSDVAAWAYAYRDIDQVRARWELEREWARQMNKTNIAPNDQWTRASELQKLILAVATLDVERARQMIFVLPVDEEGGAPFGAAQVLARWMLASEEERQTRPFSTWGQRASDDGLHDYSW